MHALVPFIQIAGHMRSLALHRTRIMLDVIFVQTSQPACKYLGTPDFKSQARSGAIAHFCRKEVWVWIFLHIGIFRFVNKKDLAWLESVKSKYPDSDLWKGSTMFTLDRWEFWRERLRWVSEQNDLKERTRDEAQMLKKSYAEYSAI